MVLCRNISRLFSLKGDLSMGKDLKGKELGIGNTGITSCCTGHRKSCGGYIWKYKEK